MALEDVVAAYRLPVRSAAWTAAFAAAARDRLGRDLPASMVRFAAAPDLAAVLAQAYAARTVFPERVEPASFDLGPALPVENVWLMTENQGVCVWAVPMDAGDDPPVLVAGDLRTGAAMQLYARTVDEFAEAWAWDLRCIGREPLVQAQAEPLDADTLAYLRATYRETVPTWGWPARQVMRFESDDGLTLTVWDDDRQCDWWISGPTSGTTRRHVAALRPCSDLAASLWSNDEPGVALLASFR